MRVRLRRMFDWWFRDRSTGRIVVAQAPNLPLAVFLVATAFRLAVRPVGAVRTTVAVVGTGALLWWAADEVVRGVNPFRRLLGAVVLAVQVAGLLR